MGEGKINDTNLLICAVIYYVYAHPSLPNKPGTFLPGNVVYVVLIMWHVSPKALYRVKERKITHSTLTNGSCYCVIHRCQRQGPWAKCGLPDGFIWPSIRLWICQNSSFQKLWFFLNKHFKITNTTFSHQRAASEKLN